MKSSLFIFLGLIALSFANSNKTENHKTQHTFLVKTELTKEQIENLLNQHHMNQTQLTQKTNLHQNENEPQENENTKTEEQETTQLKKQKKQKNKNKEQKQEKEQKPEKEQKQEQVQEQEQKQEPKAEVPTPHEEKPVAESPVEEEAEPMEQEGEKETNETTNLKKKKEQKREKKRIHNSEIKEVNETEAKELMNETEALIEVGNNNDCQNQTTNLMAKREYIEQNNLNQSNSPIFGFISVVFLTIAFVSLLVYATQPRKKVQNNYYMNQRIKVKV